MLFGKYNIVLFKDGRSGSRNMRIRGGLILFFFVFILVLIGINIWLVRQYFDNRHLDESLLRSQQIIEEQRKQLVGLVGKITDISRDLLRVQNFDAKLRIMMNMDKDMTETSGPGDFARTYLPLHRQELAARKMQDFLSRLGDSTRLEEVRQQDLLLAMREKKDTLSSMPYMWPVIGFLTSRFGPRSSPFGGGGQFHKGIDISNRIGTRIVAPAQGTVVASGHDGAYGISVEINHGGGIVTKYAHMQRAVVQVGQWVKRGETIGYIGMTGRTTGPHLHYEVKLNGVHVNPLRYILQ